MGRSVILWPDDDEVGRNHMLKLAARLEGIAAVGWIEPPSDKRKGWDAADALAEHMDVHELVRSATPVPDHGPDGALVPRTTLERVAALPLIVFDDEVAKPWPSVEFDRPGGGMQMRIEVPSTTQSPSAHARPHRVRVGYRGDGLSRSFRLPYWGYETTGSTS